MRIGIDFHGVLDDETEGWVTFCWLAKESEHEVYLISGPSVDGITRRLESIGVDPEMFTGIYSVVDHLKAKGSPMWEKPVGSGHWWADDKAWWSAKGEIAEMLSLDLMIDDSAQYGEFMPTSTKFMLMK